MNELERPSPKNMAPRRPSLQPRQRKLETQPRTTPLSRRHVPVSHAWGDTGTLCSLALRPALLNRVLDLYGGSLVVTEAVAEEVRRFTRIPAARRSERNLLLCNGADVIARHLDNGEIKEYPLPPSAGALDKLDQVLRQLKEFEAAAVERTGRASDPISSAHKHAGEAHSIVSALRTIEHGGTTVLLTNDGGAIAIAERNGIPTKHLGQVLAELACEDPALAASDLLGHFIQVTRRFATVPAQLRPSGEESFTCMKKGDSCPLCR
ncbi:hypothetical protein GCM10009579_83460 [Streptomyces javensis]|uniref:PIN domain-containing protein n=1 Tax=Streptomyces javensis TaxID=114698 RepID=A0ABP4I1D2_9ACTN